jgi:hypothetical protein
MLKKSELFVKDEKNYPPLIPPKRGLSNLHGK